MKNFKAVSMLCEREEQAKEMKKLCEKHGVEINYNWKEGCVLVNNQGGVNMSIAFVYKEFGFEFNRIVIPYNPIEFIKACGVEVEQPKTNDKIKVRIINAKTSNWYRVGEVYEVLDNDTYYYKHTEHSTILKTDCEIIEQKQQPKWEKLTRGGFEYHIYEEFDGNIFGRVYDHERWISVDWNNKGERADFVNSPYNLIPYNQRKTELLTKKAELEKQLEEINKELNQ